MILLAFIATLLAVSPHGMVNAAIQPGDNNQYLAASSLSRELPHPGLSHHILKRQQYTDFNYTGPRYESYNFSMPIDHFNASDNRTYRNRYWVNDTYYQEGGPVIWYDWGEGGITDSHVTWVIKEGDEANAAMELAKRYHGLVILWELRYYGYSLPFPLNTTTIGYREPIDAPASWKYNTLAQGLADAAYFANHFDQGDYQRDNMTTLLPQNTPWIFLGGSYPGVRAAGVRVLYPDVFFAAWSSSAPVQSRYDNSAFYNYPEMSLYPNCSTDIKAIVKYADEVMSGTHGPDAYSYLQHLAYAARSSYILNTYNASLATLQRPYDIASAMATPFIGLITNFGPVNTTWLWCDALQSFNATATGYITNDTYLSVITNPGDGLPSDNGFIATHNNNMTLALAAYFYAYAAYSNFSVPFNKQRSANNHQVPDGRADTSAWQYIVETQHGGYLGSDPNNISVVSKFANYSYLIQSTRLASFSNATLATLPERSDTEAWNRLLGGWNMNPTNVMFTAGAFDGWRAGSVFSLETENGAPGYQPSERIPACGAQLNDSNARFGIVYPDAVHVPDLFASEGVYGMGPNTPFNRGLALFSQALDVWLPCFSNKTSNATAI